MTLYLQVVRTNPTLPEDREFMVQASSTGLAGTWKNASMWFGTKEEAVDLAKQMLKEATAASRRASIVVVSSFSGETS